jgi:hypothetical protein
LPDQVRHNPNQFGLVCHSGKSRSPVGSSRLIKNLLLNLVILIKRIPSSRRLHDHKFAKKLKIRGIIQARFVPEQKNIKVWTGYYFQAILEYCIGPSFVDWQGEIECKTMNLRQDFDSFQLSCSKNPHRELRCREKDMIYRIEIKQSDFNAREPLRNRFQIIHVVTAEFPLECHLFKPGDMVVKNKNADE